MTERQIEQIAIRLYASYRDFYGGSTTTWKNLSAFQKASWLKVAEVAVLVVHEIRVEELGPGPKPAPHGCGDPECKEAHT